LGVFARSSRRLGAAVMKNKFGHGREKADLKEKSFSSICRRVMISHRSA
jgi:hypothetical protein